MDDAAILREIARRIRDGITEAIADKPARDDGTAGPDDDRHQKDLLAQLAHELRTPLGAMISAAEIMAAQRLGPIDNPQYLAYAEDIATSGRHALAVVDRVLDGWRQPAPPAPFEFAELDLNRIVERMVSVLRPLARQRDQTIAVDLAPRLPHLIADATSLRQILLNLVTNATKYAKPASEISIATRYILDGPVILEIKDQGPGMSAAEVALARGERLPVDALPRGTGFGLPLVRTLAAANGAAFAIDSAPGTATAVTLTFAKDKVVPV